MSEHEDPHGDIPNVQRKLLRAPSLLESLAPAVILNDADRLANGRGDKLHGPPNSGWSVAE